MAQVTGLAGILIYTGDYPPMLAFYRDTLGLPVRHLRQDWVNFEWPGLRLTLTLHSELHGPATDPLHVMVNFTVDDIHAIYRQLVDAGVTFSRPPEKEPWGGWIATFADPDGNTLQLFQLPV